MPPRGVLFDISTLEVGENEESNFFSIAISAGRIVHMEYNFSLLQRKEKEMLMAIVRAKRISRTALQKSSDLKIANFYNTVDALCRSGFVNKTESPNHEKKGRPSEFLSLNEECLKFLYIFLSKSKFQLGISNLNGKLSETEEMKVDENFTASDFLERCRSYHSRMKERYPIAIAAFVMGINPNSRVHSGFNDTFFDPELEMKLRSTLGIPLFSDTIARATALGIYNEKYSQKVSSLIFCNLSTGIGIGMVNERINEDFWYSNRANIEHWSLDPNGRMCYCGKRGCLATSLGTNSIVQNARSLVEEGRASLLNGDFGFPDVVQAANSGDAVAREVMDEAAKAFVQALGNLYSIFHFEVVAIGGTTCRDNNRFFQTVRKLMPKDLFDFYIEKDFISKASKGICYRIIRELLS